MNEPDRDRTKDFYELKVIPNGSLGRLAQSRGSGLRGAVLSLEGPRNRALGGIRGKRLLELGSGYGLELIEFALEGAWVVGVEFAFNRLAGIPIRAAEAGIEVTVIAGDCHALPFLDRTFDIVYGNAILAHLDRQGALAEVRRVLRPGGRLILIEPLDRHPLLRPYRRLLKGRRGIVKYLNFNELDEDHLGGGYELQQIGLISALLLPLAAIGVDGVFWRGLARLLGRLDAFLFRHSPLARRRAWVCLGLYHGRDLEPRG